MELFVGVALGFFISAFLGWIPVGETPAHREVVEIRQPSVGPEEAPLAASGPGDQDGDGMPDSWETANRHDPNNPDDADADFDRDGLTALEEYKYGKSPLGKWSVKSVACPLAGVGWNSSVSAVNRSGQALVNFSNDSSLENKTYLLDINASTWQDITLVAPGFPYIGGLDLNDHGTVAYEGWSEDWEDMIGLIREADGTTREIEDENGNPVSPTDINNAGDWVGYNPLGESFASVDGELIRPDSSWSRGVFVDINDWGEILGFYQVAGVIGSYPFIQHGPSWFFSTGITASYPFFSPSDVVMNQPWAMNNFGEFIGMASISTPPYIQRSYYYDGKFHGLAGVPPNANVGTIDDSLRIVAWGAGTQGAGILISDGVAVPISILSDVVATSSSYSAISPDGVLAFGDYNDAMVHVVSSDQDEDNDGMSDDWEDIQGLDKTSAADASADPDGDGINNLGEYRLGSNPNAAPVHDPNGNEIDVRPGVDTDGDGMPNVWEWQNGLDYDDPSDASTDPDHDGSSNLTEYGLGTDPRGRPLYRIQEVVPVGITAPDMSSALLGEGFDPTPGSPLIASNLVESVSLMVTPASGSGGRRPAQWSMKRSISLPDFALYPSHGTQTASLLASSPDGVQVASHSANPATVVYWASPTSAPISLPGGTGAANIRSVSSCSISPSGTYLAGWRVLQSSGASQAFLWKMPAGGQTFVPVQLVIPSGYTLASSSKLWVNDHGYVTATATRSGVNAALLWKMDTAGASAPSTVLAPLAPSRLTRTFGLSNSHDPIVYGNGQNGTGRMRAMAWNASGTPTDLVNGGTITTATCGSNNGIVALTKEVIVSGSPRPQSLTARYHAATGTSPAGWRVTEHGGAVHSSVAHAMVSDSGEIVGASQTFQGGPLHPTVWRQGRFFLLNDTIQTNGEHAVTSVSHTNTHGTLLARANRDGLDVRVLLIPERDLDGDGIKDSHETGSAGGPMSPAPANQDTDNDGLTDAEEVRLGTDPNSADTDGDGMPDGWEVGNGLNPLDPADAFQDPDGDLVTNIREFKIGTRPLGYYRFERIGLTSGQSLHQVGDDGSFIASTSSSSETPIGQDPTIHTSGRTFTFFGKPNAGAERTTTGLPAESVQNIWNTAQQTTEVHRSLVYFGIAGGTVVGTLIDEDEVTSPGGSSTTKSTTFIPDLLDGAAQGISIAEIGTALGRTFEPRPYISSPSQERHLLRGQTGPFTLVDQNGAELGTLPSPPPYWSKLNKEGHALALSSRNVPANNGIPAHTEWDLHFWNGTSAKTIAIPPEYRERYPDLRYFSDDGKALLKFSVIDKTGILRPEHCLVDPVAETFEVLATPPGTGAIEIVSMSSEGEKTLGSVGGLSELNFFLIGRDGSRANLREQMVRMSAEAPPARLDALGYYSWTPYHVSPDGRLTFTATNSYGLSVVQLTPDNDTNGNGISDDYEEEIRQALTDAGTPLPPGQGINDDTDHDGDGLTLAEERRRGTSDAGTSKPNESNLYRDSDRDSIPDVLDAAPGDPLIDWQKGPAPEYVVKLVGGSRGTVTDNTLIEDRLIFIDMNEDGDVLFKRGRYKVSRGGLSTSQDLETHDGDNPGSAHPGYPEYHESGCYPMGFAGNSSTIYGSTSYSWTLGSLPAGMDPDNDAEEIQAYFDNADKQVAKLPLTLWPPGTSGDRTHTIGAPGSYGISGLGGNYLTLQEEEKNAQGVITQHARLKWAGSLLDPVGGKPGHTLWETGWVDPYGNVSFYDLDQYAASMQTTGTGSTIYGLGVWTGTTNNRWLPDEFLAGRNCYVPIAVQHGLVVAHRDLLFTNRGLRVKGGGSNFELSSLKLPSVKGISKQAWILGEKWVDGSKVPYVWVNGSTRHPSSFLEEDSGYSVKAVHEMSQDGVICATVTRPNWNGNEGQLALLVPIEVHTDTSTSSVEANQAPMAPPDFRQISLDGGGKRESKPQNESETDLRGESTSVDAYTRMLRHDMSHVYVPVPTSTDIALQLSASFSNAPVSLPSSELDKGVTTANYRDDAAYLAKTMRRNVEAHLGKEVGAFGLGWTSSADCKAVLKPQSRKAREGETFTDLPGLGIPNQQRLFTHYDVEVIDETGSTHEFTSPDLRSFMPKARLVPERGDNAVSLSRRTINGVDRLVLARKHGTTLEFGWGGIIPPNPLPVRTSTANPINEAYVATPVAVRDRHGNCLLFGNGGVYVEGRPTLKLEYTRQLLSGGKGHQQFGLVTSVKDPRGKVTRFQYSWMNVLGGMIPVLSSATKEDGTTISYGYDPRIGQPVNRSEEAIRLSNSNTYFPHPLREMNTMPEQKKKPEVDVSDPRMQAVYFYLNLRGISSGAGSYTFAYEPTTAQDLVKVRYKIAVGDPTSLLTSAELVARRNLKKTELRTEIETQMGNRGASKLSHREDPGGNGGEITFSFPSMSGADKVRFAGLPGGGGMSIKTKEVIVDPPEPGEPQWADSSLPLSQTLLIPNITEVTDGQERKTTYEFGDLLSFFPSPPPGQTHPADKYRYMEDPNQPLIPTAITYQSLTISSQGKTARYTFDASANLGLSQTRDHLGNIVTYEHGETAPGAEQSNRPSLSYPTGANLYQAVGTKTPYVTREVRSANGVPVTKSFSYDSGSRLMKSVIDGRGNEAITVVNNGRRVAVMQFTGLAPAVSVPANQEAELAAAANLAAYTKYEYGNLTFPNFLTRSTIKDLGAAGDPAWVQDLVTEFTPDAYGRVAQTTVVNPGGTNLVTLHEYDLNGNRTRERNPAGHWTEFSYDVVGRLVEVRYPGAGNPKKTYGYDTAGRKIRETDELGHSSLWKYDANGNVTEAARDMNGNHSIDSADLVTRTKYNYRGYPIQTTDPNGNVTTTEYDDLNRIVKVTDAAQGVTLYSYAGANSGSGLLNGPGYKPTKIRDPRGYVTEITYDSLFRQTGERKEFRLPASMTEAQAAADETTWTSRAPNDANWTKSETAYDANGNVLVTGSWRTLPGEAHVTTTVYDSLNRPKEVATGKKRTSLLGADVSTGLESTTETLYASTGQVWKSIAYKGNTNLERHTETEYDAVSRPVKVWSPHPDSGTVVKTATAPAQPSACVETRYDANGNIAYVIDARGKRTDFAYDERNRKTETLAPQVLDYSVTPAASVRPRSFTQYDAGGNVWKVTGPRGDVSENAYDPANRLIRTTAAFGHQLAAVTQTTYDRNGNVVAVRDANGNTTRNQYDKLSRLTATAVNPQTGLPSVDFGSTAAGDVVVVNRYDAAGNLLRVADGAATKSFDGTSWTITEADGHVTGFAYDGLGRKTSQIWDIGSSSAKTLTWEYDALAQTASVNARNLRIVNTYDALLRLTQETHFGDTSGTTQYSYQGTAPFTPGVTTNSYVSGPGPMVATWVPWAGGAAVRQAHEAFYTHDRLDRVKSETSGGVTHHYSYDIAGNRTLVTYGNTGRSLVSKYDDLGRVSQIIDTTNSVSNPVAYTALGGDLSTFYRHDAASAIVGKTLPNGTITTSEYDIRGRLLTTTTKAGASTVSKFDYSQPHPATTLPSGYDAVGNVMRVVESYDGMAGREVLNTYDRTYRLATEIAFDPVSMDEVVTAYEYDKANNRTRRTVSGSGLTTVFNDHVFGTPALGFNTNQLVGIGKDNVVPNPSSVTDFKVRYTYDADGNRLTRATMPGTPGVKTDNYTRYDHRNRLSTLTMESSATPAANGLHIYLYDHRSRRTFNFTPLLSDVGRLSFSGGQSVQEYGDLYATTPAKQTIRGSDMGGGVGGVLYTNVGSTSPVFNHYNSRGDVVSQTNNGGGVEWEAKYEAFGTRTEEAGAPTGRQRANTKDEDLTGLLNEGMRYRDPEAGVFITRDPAGFVDGPNVYTYVRQNPWSKFDPEGLWEISVFGLFKFSSEAPAENAAKLSQGFSEVTGRKFGMDKIEELKRNPAEFAEGLGRGYLNPDGDPQSLAEETGQFIAIGEALVSLGRSATMPGGNSGLKPAFATGNAPSVQAVPTTATGPLPAGAILQNNQELKPGGKSQRDISQENAAKGPPNPFGKKGGPAHQSKVGEIQADIESRGLTAQTEHMVKTAGGTKEKRFIDVVGKDADGNIVEMHQVGKQTKGGAPVSREVKALDDIEGATGSRPNYHPYNQP